MLCVGKENYVKVIVLAKEGYSEIPITERPVALQLLRVYLRDGKTPNIQTIFQELGGPGRLHHAKIVFCGTVA